MSDGPARVHGSRAVASWLLFAAVTASVVTCQSSASSREAKPAAPAPAGQPAAPAVRPAAKGTGDATAADAPKGELTLDGVVALVAQRRLWPLGPDAAEKKLAALGPWKRDQPLAEVLTLVGPSSGVVERTEISYSSDGNKGWLFVGGTIFVRGSNLPELQKTVADLVSSKLGKPRWTRRAEGGDAASAGWKLGARQELLVKQSPVAGEKLLAIMISEPQATGAAD